MAGRGGWRPPTRQAACVEDPAGPGDSRGQPTHLLPRAAALLTFTPHMVVPGTRRLLQAQPHPALPGRRPTPTAESAVVHGFVDGAAVSWASVERLGGLVEDPVRRNRADRDRLRTGSTAIPVGGRWRRRWSARVWRCALVAGDDEDRAGLVKPTVDVILADPRWRARHDDVSGHGGVSVPRTSAGSAGSAADRSAGTRATGPRRIAPPRRRTKASSSPPPLDRLQEHRLPSDACPPRSVVDSTGGAAATRGSESGPDAATDETSTRQDRRGSWMRARRYADASMSARDGGKPCVW
jgi:hypothetical protein